MPIFEASNAVTVRHRQFRVAFVVYHHGLTPTAGHYQAALSTTAGSTATASWHFQICNDDCPPRNARPADLRDIQRLGYLVGLVRDITA